MAEFEQVQVPVYKLTREHVGKLVKLATADVVVIGRLEAVEVSVEVEVASWGGGTGLPNTAQARLVISGWGGWLDPWLSLLVEMPAPALEGELLAGELEQ